MRRHCFNEVFFYSGMIFFLISSVFLRTFFNAFFRRNFPPTVTNVQKVWSTMTFSFFVVEFSLMKSKFIIFSWSCCVWVNESRRLTSPSRFILQNISWYLNNSFRILGFIYVKCKENIMIALLIWGFSNLTFAPKLMNKQW